MLSDHQPNSSTQRLLNQKVPDYQEDPAACGFTRFIPEVPVTQRRLPYLQNSTGHILSMLVSDGDWE
jgi:hypothetical protein